MVKLKIVSAFGKEWFMDTRIGQARNIFNSHDFMSIDEFNDARYDLEEERDRC